MANFFFIIAHILAVVFGFVWLILTVPFHLFYLNGKKSKAELIKQTEILEKQNSEKEGQAAGKASEIESLTDCPFCAEKIKKEAIVCKHCGRDIVKTDSE
jgi:hypothetical protein